MKRETLVRCAVLLVLVVPGAFASAAPDEKYWITFVDKGPGRSAAGALSAGSADEQAARAQLSTRAIERRRKVLPEGALVTAADLPVAPRYVARLNNLGVRVVRELRWMNAVSALLSESQLAVVRRLPFVASVAPVLRLRVPAMPADDPPPPLDAAKTASLNYGTSLAQNQMINVPVLHDFGIAGKRVILGMLDTGVRWRLHEALETREVLGEYDFIQNDSVTANQAGDASGQDTHGTLTFSVAGGYMPGKLVGPAYASSFLFAKTEYLPAEYMVEEDHWAAGIEWMEGRGADVVSSSLGYNSFDDGPGYFWASGDFNGRTSVTAQAAIRAARLGVTVCDAMGNEGNGDGVAGTMLTPADTDSIISVGGVSFTRRLYSMSGTGPTNDGRTKPDVAAPAVGVYGAVPGTAGYTSATGTSLATPLVAGAAALILSARPELTPIQVRDALRATADTVDTRNHAVFPNNFTGWGLVNAFQAALSFGPIFSNEPTIGLSGAFSTVSISVASRFGITPGSVVLTYAIGASPAFTSIPMALDSAMVYPTSGRYSAVIPLQPQGTVVRFTIDASDDSGHAYASPAPVRATSWQLFYGTTGVGAEPPLPAATELLQNYPNPFNPETRVRYRLAEPGFVTCTVYDLLGREVATLVSERQPAGEHAVTWNAAGRPSGVYFYRLVAGSSVKTRTMILLR
jgi:subtilisin family serine protease